MTHPSWKPSNLKRAVDRARRAAPWLDGSSRHVHMIAEGLLSKHGYPMLQEEPEHCAQSMLAVLKMLWRSRAEMEKLKARLARYEGKP